MILVFCCIGVYTVNNTAFDVWIIAVFGVIDTSLPSWSVKLAPICCSFILGPMMKKPAFAAFARYWSVFIQRPIGAAILVLSLSC